jgi:hypothetical protein
MNKALITSVIWLLGSASQAAAASVCPVHNQGEADGVYAGRAHDYCEARWREMVAHNRTGGRTHDEFIDNCSRTCIGAVAEKGAGNQVLLIAGGVVLAGAAAGAAAASGGHGSSASP